jgi:hypothetical protein
MQVFTVSGRICQNMDGVRCFITTVVTPSSAGTAIAFLHGTQ